MSDQRVVRPAPISGFPEWTPQVRSVEQRWLDHIRAGFESFGFASVETPSVENLEVLTAKGETSQEVYTLHRLQSDPKDDSDARLGLHFDLTVPFARYVAQHFNELTFPFKRYQMQRVWRGERPQEGRYREFTQCDIDVINVDSVPLHFDAELPRIVHRVLSGLDIPAWTLNVNNRKVLQGFYEGLGVKDPIMVIRAVDKLHKIGDDGVREILTGGGLSAEQADACLALARVRGTGADVPDRVRGLGVSSPLLEEGLEELSFVLDDLADLPEGAVVADLSIARGLDYYTGTVYEASFDDDPGYGSICAGGRYEDLAGQFIRRRLPGVGISIGLTRIFAKLVAEGRIGGGRICPTDVMVVVPGAERRRDALAVGELLRSRGFNTEVFHSTAKVGKQIQYASKKGIPFVWFPPFDEDGGHEVKDMGSGEQAAADPASWSPGDRTE
ncbi:histidine--tRNA ligase [Nocardiopsis changdeensis]|uniref:Histidine--tRNA ligase n=1 Tax=Nocardiopsis changdeensis TaxID=2831969 RepID=A0ABX8BQI5_9ACTN|nr:MULTISPECIES: histidine--tRNA ligase [Nocardiopsis]QUX24003.1 histidine--tRNA ligase [Nocardiopsis changdeensis]QYX34399.1 histidine--tRNA ligase [Nocardiopsis sp. MT53]